MEEDKHIYSSSRWVKIQKNLRALKKEIIATLTPQLPKKRVAPPPHSQEKATKSVAVKEEQPKIKEKPMEEKAKKGDKKKAGKKKFSQEQRQQAREKIFTTTLLLAMSVIMITGILVSSRTSKNARNKNLPDKQKTPTVSPSVSKKENEVYISNSYKYQITYPGNYSKEEVNGELETDPLHTIHLLDPNKQKTLEMTVSTYRKQELKILAENLKSQMVGHITDKIENEEKFPINGDEGLSITYHRDVSTNKGIEKVEFTTLLINSSEYSFALTAPTSSITELLSNFKMMN
jgi:hypothetical protein